MTLSGHRGFGGRAFRLAIRLGLWLAALIVGSILWLEFLGVPVWLRDRILAEVHARGVLLTIEQIRFSLGHGLVVDGAAWYAHPGDTRPALLARHVDLDCDWLGALARKPLLESIEADGVTVDLLPRVAGSRAAVTNIALAARLEPGGLRVERFRASLPGFELHARGYVVGLGVPGSSRDKPQRPPAWPDEAIVQGWLARMDAWDLPAFNPGSQASIEFLVCPDEPARSEVGVRGAGPGLNARGLRFDGWSVAASWRTGTVTLTSAVLRRDVHTVRAAGSFEPASNLVELAASGSLPVSFVRAVPLPPLPAARLARVEVLATDPFAFEVRIDRGPLTNAAGRIAARIRLSQLEALGVPIERADIRLRREGSLLRFESIDAIVGRDDQRGPLHGSGTFDLPSGVYAGSGTTAFDPAVLLPLMHPVQAQIVGAAVFRASPPEADFRVSGQLSDMRKLVLDARLHARDFVYQGSHVVEATAHIAASNEVMRIDDLNLVRREGTATGWIEQDFHTRQARMDVRGDANPQAVARMVAPAVHRFAQKFRVEGPVRWQAAGTVDYGGLRANDLAISVEAERLGLRWFVTDRAKFDLRLLGRRVEISNLEGRLCGGPFAGHAVFELPDGDRLLTRYALDGRIENADFRMLMGALTDSDHAPYSGRMDATLRVGGLMGPGQARTATGDGTLRIRDGRLFQIPLFGEFSRRFLNRISPGLGFAQQSEFRTAFKIADGRASTDEAELLGEIVTMRARGSYGFDEKLDFAIEAKLLREGAVAEIFRLLTLPLTKLFEFDLVGTQRHPEWRPHNLPEELWRLL